MKVFENIDAFERERPTFSGLSDDEITELAKEMRRIIRDLTPLRKSRKATEEYYHNYLCRGEILERYEEKMDMLRVCQPGYPEKPYQPTGKETRFEEDILHSALIKVLKDDRYSFGHLYWFMCSRVNRQMGIAFYDDIVVSDKVIEYATDFDVEELHAKYRTIGDIIDRLDYIDMQLIESKKFVVDEGDTVLNELKSHYESVANYIKDLTEKRLSSLDRYTAKPGGQVKEIPFYEDSVGYIESGKTDYLTYYDFRTCPVDVSQYPFSVHLGRYRIVRTERGLEDANPLFIEILRNTYRQVGFAGGAEAEDIFNETRHLLKALYRSFIEECHNQFGDDFNTIYMHSKWWTLNSARCLNSAFSNDVLPESNAPVPEYDVPNYRADAWMKCNFFRKTMIEYCIYLTVNVVVQASINPYKAVHKVIPFNYYGENYDSVVNAAQKKRLKTEKDREATEYLANCQSFRPYLEKRLSALDGKQINDPESVEERHRIATDLIEMANSYLGHLEDAEISDAAAMKYAIELWSWIVHGTMDYLIKAELMKNYNCLMPSELTTDEEAERINNTGRQYVSFRKCFNVQMTQAQHEFITYCLSLDRDGTPLENFENYVTEPDEEEKDTGVVEEADFTPHIGITIDVDAIYNHIKTYVATDLSLQDFEEAIKHADFSKLLADAKRKRVSDYPLLIITKIKGYFDKDWYDACCQSLKMEARRVSGYHRDGTMGTLSFRFPGKLTK